MPLLPANIFGITLMRSRGLEGNGNARFTDMVAGKLLRFQNKDTVPVIGKHGGLAGSGRSSADNGNIVMK